MEKFVYEGEVYLERDGFRVKVNPAFILGRELGGSWSFISEGKKWVVFSLGEGKVRYFFDWEGEFSFENIFSEKEFWERVEKIISSLEEMEEEKFISFLEEKGDELSEKVKNSLLRKESS